MTIWEISWQFKHSLGKGYGTCPVAPMDYCYMNTIVHSITNKVTFHKEIDVNITCRWSAPALSPTRSAVGLVYLQDECGECCNAFKHDFWSRCIAVSSWPHCLPPASRTRHDSKFLFPMQASSPHSEHIRTFYKSSTTK